MSEDTKRAKHKERERERQRERERERERERDRQTDRQTDRQKDRETERQRQGDRERSSRAVPFSSAGDALSCVELAEAVLEERFLTRQAGH